MSARARSSARPGPGGPRPATPDLRGRARAAGGRRGPPRRRAPARARGALPPPDRGSVQPGTTPPVARPASPRAAPPRRGPEGAAWTSARSGTSRGTPSTRCTARPRRRGARFGRGRSARGWSSSSLRRSPVGAAARPGRRAPAGRDPCRESTRRPSESRMLTGTHLAEGRRGCARSTSFPCILPDGALDHRQVARAGQGSTGGSRHPSRSARSSAREEIVGPCQSSGSGRRTSAGSEGSTIRTGCIPTACAPVSSR